MNAIKRTPREIDRISSAIPDRVRKMRAGMPEMGGINQRARAAPKNFEASGGKTRAPSRKAGKITL